MGLGQNTPDTYVPSVHVFLYSAEVLSTGRGYCTWPHAVWTVLCVAVGLLHSWLMHKPITHPMCRVHKRRFQYRESMFASPEAEMISESSDM